MLWAELDAGLEPMFQCNLKPHLPASDSATWLAAADNQSIIICAMHRSTDSWVTTFSLLAQPSHSWGHFVPELRNALAQLPGFPVQKLAAAQDGAADKASQLTHARCNASRRDWLLQWHTSPAFPLHDLLLVIVVFGLRVHV